MRPGRIAVVEPHSDDAWLSLGGHLAGWHKAGIETRIVTVYGDADITTGPRWHEAARYARTVGAEWVGLGHTESNRGIADRTWTPATIDGALLDAVLDGWHPVFPLGLVHPEHLAVARLAPPGAWRYMEQPYAAKTKNDAEVTVCLAGANRIESWRRPTAHKLKHHSIFASQRHFWFHEADVMVNAPELIVS